VAQVDPRLEGPSGFKNFLWLAWNALGLPEPTPVQYDIAEYLAGGPKRSVVQAFRGVGKSYITSAYVVPISCWWTPPRPFSWSPPASSELRRLQRRSPCGSSKRCRSLTQHLRPKENQRSSKVAFDVGPAAPCSASPSVTSKGITQPAHGIPSGRLRSWPT
jgi:hypothetical protein